MVLSLGLGLTRAGGGGPDRLQPARARSPPTCPTRAPAYFFVDIQNDQLAGFLDNAPTASPGVTEVETAPMLRGIITRINGRPAREVAGNHWALRGDRGVTYAAAPPAGHRADRGRLVAERLRRAAARSASPPRKAAEMGLKLGDEITVNVLGRDITATITSFREVNFETMGINFLMVVDPAALAGAPHTHIATVYADAAGRGAAPARRSPTAYPNITAIRVREAIDRFADGARRPSRAATRWAARGDAADRLRGADRRRGGGRAARGSSRRRC